MTRPSETSSSALSAVDAGAREVSPGVLRRWDATGIPMLIARLAVGGILIASAVPKLENLTEFLKVLKTYGMLPLDPPEILNALAIYMPFLELVLGLFIIAGFALRGAFLITLGMLVVFTGAVFARGLAIGTEQGIGFFQISFDCGCGSGVQILWQKLLKNTGLILLSAVGLWCNARRFTLERWTGWS